MSGGETSKQSAKRARMQEKAAKAASIVSARQQGKESLRISDGSSNSLLSKSAVAEPNIPGGMSIQEKPKYPPRGKAKLLEIGKKKRKRLIEVEFNQRSQPIGIYAAKFSSFLGVSARELIPMTAPTWKELSDTFKNQIWEHVTTSFIVDECHKKQIFRRMIKLWRDNRSIVLKEVMKQASVVGLQRAAALLKPDNIESMDEWQAFVKFRTNPAFREMCEKFKAMRAQKTLLHKTSRKSFACLEEELKEQSEMPDAISRSDVWIHAYEATKKKGSNEVVEDPEIVKQVKMYKAEQEPSQNCSLKDDAVAKVIGPDPRGRVRGLGFGAVPSKADYQTNVGNKVTKLENALLAQAQDMLSQSEEIQRLKEMVGTLFARSEKGVNNHGSTSAQQSANQFSQQKEPENQSVGHCSNDVAQSKQKVARQGSENKRPQSKQSKHNQKEGTRNKGNKDDQNRVELLSWFEMGKEVIATAKVESKDPSVKVHHVPLVHECWKV